VIVHLIDGTFELFRHFYGLRRFNEGKDAPFGAVSGVLGSVLQMIETGATHIGVATDHVIESFRNKLYSGYKTGEGIDPALWRQFHPLEEALAAMGVAIWPMTDLEADDALASAAHLASKSKRVEKVSIWTPDKDLAQCVRGTRVVLLDRMRRRVLDEGAVKAKFGVLPESIPDWLALVGDDADGYPGLPGWGAKTAAAVLSRYVRLEDIPDHDGTWAVPVRGASAVAQRLRDRRADAFLYRSLARLRTDVPLPETLEDLRWRGSRRPELEALCAEIGEPDVAARMPLWRES
jgi:5'-3' exonuclease